MVNYFRTQNEPVVQIVLDQADVLKGVLVALGFDGISLDIFGLENRVTL